MRLLVIGGSGLVGSLTLPMLSEQHTVRVFDLRPPREPVAGVDYIAGDVQDADALGLATKDIDALVFMAMGPFREGKLLRPAAHFDVSPKGLYLAAAAASENGVKRLVYTSSMSVFGEPEDVQGHYPDESVAPNAMHFYGLAKRFGEEVCKAAVIEWGMTAVALRLCLPTPADRWPPTHRPNATPIATSGRDTARAILAALEYDGGGFEAITISGDAGGQVVTSLDKAKRLLGWEPLDPLS